MAFRSDITGLSSVREAADVPGNRASWSIRSGGDARGTRGRRRSWLLGAALLATGVAFALPVVGGADGVVGTTVTLTSSENPIAYGSS